MLLCYPISRQRQQVAMLNATLEYNKLTSLARIQHVKWESDYEEKSKRGRTDQWWRKLFEGRMLTYLALEMFSVSERKGRL